MNNAHRHNFEGIDSNKRIICKMNHGCEMYDLAKLFILYLSLFFRFIFLKKTMYHYQNLIYTIKICLHEPTRQLNTGIFPGTFCVNCKWA